MKPNGSNFILNEMVGVSCAAQLLPMNGLSMGKDAIDAAMNTELETGDIDFGSFMGWKTVPPLYYRSAELYPVLSIILMM